MKALEVLIRMEADQVIGKYAVGGAVAASLWIEPGTTFDLDIFVAWENTGSILSLEPVYEYLRGKGYDSHNPDGAIIVEGWPIQFLPPTGPLIENALKEAVTIDIEGVFIPVFTQEHLMAICLETGRNKDKARLLQFLEDRSYDPAAFEALLTRYGLQRRWDDFNAAFPSS